MHVCIYGENETHRQDIEIYYSCTRKIDLIEAKARLSNTTHKFQIKTAKFLHFYYFFIAYKQKARV